MVNNEQDIGSAISSLSPASSIRPWCPSRTVHDHSRGRAWPREPTHRCAANIVRPRKCQVHLQLVTTGAAARLHRDDIGGKNALIRPIGDHWTDPRLD